MLRSRYNLPTNKNRHPCQKNNIYFLIPKNGKLSAMKTRTILISLMFVLLSNTSYAKLSCGNLFSLISYDNYKLDLLSQIADSDLQYTPAKFDNGFITGSYQVVPEKEIDS